MDDALFSALRRVYYGKQSKREWDGDVGGVRYPTTSTRCSTTNSAHEKLTTSHRSDIILPLAGWRGEMGIDWERARACFGDWVE